MSHLSRTSNSFYSQSISPTKINFQTKFKIRGTNQFIQKNSLNDKVDNIRPTTFAIPKNLSLNQSALQKKTDKDQFGRSCLLLSNLNFSHHQSQQCLCSECLCGRHVCKLHIVKPDLRKSSTYRSNFKRAKSIRNDSFLQKQSHQSLPKVEMNSTYALSFKDKDPNIVVKEHPNDQLSFEGPSQKMTSYKAYFPGNRGKNPYVRPKQVFASGQFPLKNKQSAYRQSFDKFYPRGKNQSGKNNDQLKTGDMSCFRESFYQQKFKNPNPQDYTRIFKNLEKLEVNPSYVHQYESSYDKEYARGEVTVCPAKIKIQTKLKDSLINMKNNFNQNSDFKAFSSSFNALSMSPPGQF